MQPSFASQVCPEGHSSFLGVWMQLPWPHSSTVHAMLSLQSLASQHVVQVLAPAQHFVPAAQSLTAHTPFVHLAVWHPPTKQSDAVSHLSLLVQPFSTSQ